eukprot:scaffold3801_cov150-Skeletonema_menzelii.AAC.11
MSEGEDIEAGTCCASCGIAEIDDIKLMDCDDCDLVKYCSDECQQNHKSEHEEDCKKRAAELRDELLFKQPESSYLGDCPICCLPLPIDTFSMTQFCCSKTICKGCYAANIFREGEMRLKHKCPFCREPIPDTHQECDKQWVKRIEANDPVALCQEGTEQYDKGDYIKAFEYFTKAAELGNIRAHFRLSVLYHHGEGVEKDNGKKIYHAEEAAIGGHPQARYNLGCYEWNDYDNRERAIKHWIIAASQGEDDSIKQLMNEFKGGFISKEDLAAALRAHQAAVDATKSPHRQIAAEIRSK